MEKYNGKYVTVMLCSQCNNNCKHCYVGYKGRFTDEQLAILIPKLNEKYSVILNGTEPILFPEYFKYFNMVNEDRILTNGIEILKNPNIMVDLNENNIKEVWISYHFDIQNQISKIKEKQLDDLVHILKENGFIVKLMCSLSVHNYQNISTYCERAKSIGADKIKFTNFISEGSAKSNFANQEFLTQDQINEVLFKIDELRNITLKEDLVIQRCGTFGPNIHKNNFNCLAGRDMVVLTPEGKLYDCVFNISNDSCIGYFDENYNLMVNKNKVLSDNSYCKVLRKYNKIGG